MGLVDIQRQAEILKVLKVKKVVTVAELVEALNVSPATIRRDLTRLEQQDHLLRTYGGAIFSPPTQFEYSYPERLARHIKEKRAIAAHAANLVRKGYSIFLDPGTTTLQLAEALKSMDDLTVVTNGLEIAQLLGNSPGINIYLLGGRFQPKSQDLVGPAVISGLSQYAVDIAFLSVAGFHPAYGLSASDQNNADIVRAVMRNSQCNIVLADSSKGNNRAFAQICPIEDVDVIISDVNLDPGLVDQFKQRNVRLELV